MRPTNPLLRRVRHLNLTTKQGPHNYYKGNRTGSMGEHTKYGGYVVNYDKVRTYVPPPWDAHFAVGIFSHLSLPHLLVRAIQRACAPLFHPPPQLSSIIQDHAPFHILALLTQSTAQLTPFVSNRVTPMKRRYNRGEGGPMYSPNSGRYYLELWKDKGRDRDRGDDYDVDGTYIGASR